MSQTKFAVPTWKDFFPFLPKKNLSNDDALEPFRSKATYYTMNGRNAIYWALQSLHIPKHSTIFIPAYHCRALVEPILKYGCSVVYYEINQNLEINFLHLKQQIENESKTQSVSALLCIHFFGFAAPMQKLRTLCDEYHLKLIEDCTHALFGKIGPSWMGSFGDAAIFSFRKTAAVQDGGALFLKDKNIQPLTLYFKTPFLYQFRMAKWTGDFLLGKVPLIKFSSAEDKTTDDLSAHPIVKPVATSRGPNSHEDADFEPGYLHLSMSFISSWIFKRADADAIRKIRQHHYLWFNEKLKHIEGVHLFNFEIDSGFSPLGFPFWSNSKSRVDYALRKQGIAAFSFGEDLHSSLQKKDFPETEFLSQHVCLLPVHQSLSQTDLEQILSAVKNHFKPMNSN